MKKVTAFVGTPTKKHTYSAVSEFLERLEALGGVESEIVRLSDYHLEICKVCKQCTSYGSERCPLKDDRDILIEKMMNSDGVVFASPNVSFQVSGLMKVFLDRLGYAFHRPRFFGKTFTSIVAQGIYGGKKLVKYLDFVGFGLGFNVVNGSYFTAFEPMTQKEQQKRHTMLDKHAVRFHTQLEKPAYRKPSLVELMAFRMGRSSIKQELDERFRDYQYYTEKGWFESDYYYPTHLGVVKKAAGSLFDTIGTRMSKNRVAQLRLEQAQGAAKSGQVAR